MVVPHDDLKKHAGSLNSSHYVLCNFHTEFQSLRSWWISNYTETLEGQQRLFLNNKINERNDCSKTADLYHWIFFTPTLNGMCMLS